MMRSEYNQNADAILDLYSEGRCTLDDVTAAFNALDKQAIRNYLEAEFLMEEGADEVTQEVVPYDQNNDNDHEWGEG